MKKEILITGGAGFIGSNFIHYLLDETNNDYNVINLDALTYAGNLDNLANLSIDAQKRYKFIKGNINNAELIKNIFRENNICGVINFAAESHVDNSIKSPFNFIKTNIIGTFNLLEASRQNSFNDFRFLHISTDEVYGSLGKNGLFTETTAYDPSSPYSASKASSDHLVKAYYKTYKFPTLVTNCSNNYGRFQYPEKLIPLMILNIFKEKKLPVYGDGKNVRDWLYVLDHCEAILKVFEKGDLGETYNIGGNSEFQNIEIVKMVCNIMDEKLKRKTSSEKLIEFVEDRAGHDRRYAIDASKIKNTLKWTPKYNFYDALEKTVFWYLENMDWVRNLEKKIISQ